MGRAREPKLAGELIAVVVVTAGTVVGGCGVGPHTAGNGDRVGTVSRISAPGPLGGSQAEARTVGRRLLDRITLPRGSRRIGPRPLPPRAQVVGSSNLVDESRFFWVPLPMAEAARYLKAHPPAGTRDLGDGYQREGGFSGQFVFYGLTSPPPGIDRADSQLLVSLAAGPHRGTVLRADAEMVWYPPRSAAEYVPSSAYRRVTVRASFSWRKPSTVTRSFTSTAIIGKIARLFDDLHTVPPGTVFCPAINPSFTITFWATRSRPRLIVTPDGCIGDLITVAGKVQPGLDDFESMRVMRAIAPLLGVHRKFW